MATEDNFIVAIELGSSTVTAIAGRKQPDGTISVRAFAQEKSDTFIRKGQINNFTKTTSCIEGMKEKLESKLHKTISSAYVGLGGMGIHTVSNTVTHHLGDKVQITPEIIRNVEDSNRAMHGGDYEILAVIPQDYKLGTQIVTDPEGIPTDVIEGHFLNIVANTSLREAVGECFNKAGIRVAGSPISVLTLADAILTESEKRSGCVFVDMGAETTSVAIYKSNLLRHLAVIPLGGASINRDLGTFQIENAEAESLKLRYGTAYREEDEEERPAIALNDGRSVKYEDFSNLVQARMEEIILNVKHQIELSGYKRSQLIAGLVITGGASNIKGADKAFTELTGFDRLRLVKNLRLQYKTDPKSSATFNADGSCNTAIAIIDKGVENCCGGELGDPNGGLFGTQGTDPAQPVTPTPAPAGGEVKKPVNEPPSPDKAEENEEKPNEPKTPRFSNLKKMWNKLANKANALVNDDEERFPNSKDANN